MKSGQRNKREIEDKCRNDPVIAVILSVKECEVQLERLTGLTGHIKPGVKVIRVGHLRKIFRRGKIQPYVAVQDRLSLICVDRFDMSCSVMLRYIVIECINNEHPQADKCGNTEQHIDLVPVVYLIVTAAQRHLIDLRSGPEQKDQSHENGDKYNSCDMNDERPCTVELNSES